MLRDGSGCHLGPSTAGVDSDRLSLIVDQSRARLRVVVLCIVTIVLIVAVLAVSRAAGVTIVMVQMMRRELRVVEAIRLEHDDLVLVALVVHLVGILRVIRDPALRSDLAWPLRSMQVVGCVVFATATRLPLVIRIVLVSRLVLRVLVPGELMLR